MVTRTVEVLYDDLDDTLAAQTVPFGLDGVTYEIDLSEENADRFRALLAPYVSAARRTGGRRKPPQVHPEPAPAVVEATAPTSPAPAAAKGAPKKKKASRRGKSSESGDRLKEVRAWAAENGYQVSDRGRVPSAVLEAYDAATQERASA